MKNLLLRLKKHSIELKLVKKEENLFSDETLLTILKKKKNEIERQIDFFCGQNLSSCQIWWGVIAIAFYHSISASFDNSICAASNFKEMVDCCVENIDEFVNVIQKFYSARNFQLDRCQIRLLLENLKLYLGTERKSSRLLRRYFFSYINTIFETKRVRVTSVPSWFQRLCFYC